MTQRSSVLFAYWLVLCLTGMAAVAAEVSTLVSSINASGDISVGPDGQIYAADFGQRLNNADGSQVYRITAEGEVSVFATGLAGPSGNAFDSLGNLIQANIAGNRIDRIDPQGNVTTIADSGFSSPVGVAINQQDTIFVANCGSNTISRIEGTTGVALASGLPLSCPNGLTIDPNGNLYAANFNNGNVVKISPDGSMSVLASTPTSNFRPSGGNGHIAFGNGRLYVVSNAAAQIFELSLAGELTLIAGDGTRGHADGAALESSFSSPNGIALSADGKTLFVNEAESTQGITLNTATFPLNPSLLRSIQLTELFSINPGLNGAWYNPATVGQGLFFDIIPSQGVLFAAWFTYESEDGGVLPAGANERRWYTLQGPYQADTANVEVLLASGGEFDLPTEVTNGPTGSATVTFHSCEEATLAYELENGLAGTTPLVRLTPDNFCVSLTQPSD